MSMFENDQYRWRETYFVLFESSKRPTLEKVQQALLKLNSRFALTNLSANEAGGLESLTVLSPDDFAATTRCGSRYRSTRASPAIALEDTRSGAPSLGATRCGLSCGRAVDLSGAAGAPRRSG